MPNENEVRGPWPGEPPSGGQFLAAVVFALAALLGAVVALAQARGC